MSLSMTWDVPKSRTFVILIILFFFNRSDSEHKEEITLGNRYAISSWKRSFESENPTRKYRCKSAELTPHEQLFCSCSWFYISIKIQIQFSEFKLRVIKARSKTHFLVNLVFYINKLNGYKGLKITVP